jgi:peptide/nickel transport system substrate-binding protein
MRVKCIVIFFVIIMVLFTSPVLAGKGHIKIGLSDIVQNLDYYSTAHRTAIYIAYMIYDPLFEREATTGKIKPHLVTSWKAIDPLTWEFKLRSGIKFHNGNPLTAEAVKFTLKNRILDLERKSPQRPGFTWVKDVEVVDNLTFRVTTEKPYPLVLERLSILFPYDPQWTKQMIAKHGEEYLGRHAVGTGPFKLSKYMEGERIELVRNDDYWKPGVPAFPKMTIRFIPEASTRLAELVAGGLDDAVEIGADMVPLLEKNKNLKVTEVPILRIAWWQLDGDCRAPDSPKALEDVRVRRAIWHAIDREAIVKHVLGGHAGYLNLPINPMAFGADPNQKAPEYDLNEAKALMKAAGYEDGFTLTVVSLGSEYHKFNEATAGYLEKINVKVSLQNYIGRWGEFSKRFKAGKADGATCMHWGSYNIFDADAIWPYFFMIPESAYNYNKDEELSRWLREARETIDQDKRKKLYHKAQQRIIDQAYWIPLYVKHAIHGTNIHFDYQLGADQVPRWQYGVWKE